MISTPTVEVQKEVLIVNRKRRRQRKRSRKKSKNKNNSESTSNITEAILHEDVEEYLVAVGSTTIDEGNTEEGHCDKIKEDGEAEGKQCGCQTATVKEQLSTELQKRRRRRHRSRHKRLGQALDQQMNDILEADIVKHIEEECYRFHTPDFVAPAFKVHQRCEHPNYSAQSSIQATSKSHAQVNPLDDTLKSKGKLVITKRKEKMTSAKTKAQLEEAKAVEKQNRKLKQMQHKIGNAVKAEAPPMLTSTAATPPVGSVEEVSVSVNSIEELNIGDIFYFNQLILKDSEPVVELTKAKLFMKMFSPGENKPNALLFRPFTKFDHMNSSAWWSEDDQLSEEPFIIKFQEMSQVRKHVGMATN